MKLTRRRFLQVSIGAGLSLAPIPGVLKVLKAAAAGRPPVIWLQGQGCTGCSVSLLNTVHPSIADVLLEIISVKYHPTVMAAAGDLAESALENCYKEHAGEYILIMEGSIPTAEDGQYCRMGETTLLSVVKRLAEKAYAVVGVGTCASYGGIPKAEPNPTGAKGIGEVIEKPVLNIPGCPAHPDWIVGSLVHVLLFGLPDLDEYGRPKLFYGRTIHEKCENFSYFSKGEFAKRLSDEGCVMGLGCKGVVSFSDCPERHWNNGVNWCIGARAPCIGCVQPEFPDRLSPFYTHLPEELLPKEARNAWFIKEVENA